MNTISKQHGSGNFFVGKSGKMKNIMETVEKISPFNATVLLTGESGVGKNQLAELIHSLSDRSNLPMVTINCSAIPSNLLESELFGYERGAFTGAKQQGKVGLIETAHNSSLFLDEIADLPTHMQVKLLRVIQEKKFMRLGGVEEISVDFRLISTTNKDIPSLINEGLFRQDLFYRLNTITIDLPPLREREEDIPEIINFFLEKFNKKHSLSHTISKEAIASLTKYPWPGNIRELENILEGIILTADSNLISNDSLPMYIRTSTHINKFGQGNKTLKEILSEIEKQVLFETYEIHGTTTKTAEVLGISQASVSLKLKKYNYDKRRETS